MKKNIIPLIITSLLFFLYSCIEFRTVKQPTISAPNDIINVEISAYSERGGYVPYFGVCIPIGWTIPGDSLRSYGAYDMVIYYDSLVSFEQDSVSPAPVGYYWWAGKGEEGGGEGLTYTVLEIQTDSQVGVFSIDYMLGSDGNGVNYTRSDGHLIEITTDPVLISVDPEAGYQNITMDIDIIGLNTRFNEGSGTQNVWLSQNNNLVYANSFDVNNNTSLLVNFSIPGTATLGMWDVNVETDIDGIITKTDGFEILPPVPTISVIPDSIYIEVLPGSIKTKSITISNNGWNDLVFDMLPSSGCALQFDGEDDYVCIDSFDLSYESVTVAAWVYLNDISESREIINNKGEDFQLEIWNNLSIMFDAVGNESRLNSDPNVMPLNQWVHLAGVYNGTVSKIYMNGVLVAERDFIGTVNKPNTTIYIGTETDANSQFWKGYIDEVSIWDVALYWSDIQSMLNGEMTGTEEELLGYWQFNEGKGDTTYDITANGNNGCLMGGVKWVKSTAPVSLFWLSFSPDSGVCYPDSSIEIILTFDASELCVGDYYGSLYIVSNDPLNSYMTIPIHMKVSLTPAIENEFIIPSVFSLSQNFPNPFNPSTTIQYSIKERTPVQLMLYDILGRVVEVLVNEEQYAGYYKVNFNGSRLASGIYLYRLKAGSFIETKKMLLIK
jgi:hypothetical protein